MSVFTENRIGRLVYLGWMFPICVISGFLTAFVREELYGDEASTALLWIGIISAGVAAFPVVKRLHDLNKSGWLWLLGLIPLVNLILGICLLVGKGTAGVNDYGNPPAKLLKKIRIGPPSIISRSDNDEFYQQAYEELENGQMDKALWAKIFSQCGGNENKAKALYIRSRVEQLNSKNSQKIKDVVGEKLSGLQTTKPDFNPRKNRKLSPGRFVLILGIVVGACLVVSLLHDKQATHSFSTTQKRGVGDVENAKGISTVTYHEAVAPVFGPQEGKIWTADLGDDFTMGFIPIVSGVFMMGSEDGRLDEKPVHRVMISKPFWMAKTEVTQQQYEKIIGSNPSKFQGLDNPVERVSWKNAMIFCQKLAQKDRQSGRLSEGYEYTLPSAAQWEYACRMGVPNNCGGILNAMGWYASSGGRGTHPVAQLCPNQWGLYDMHGNVAELCLDRVNGSALSLKDGESDPIGRSGLQGLAEGGHWCSSAEDCDAGRTSCAVIWAEKDGVVLDIGTVDQGLKNTGFRPIVSAVVAE